MNVRLKLGEPSAHPRATNVGVAQGIAYVDFGFIEPTLLAAIAKTAKDGQAAPKRLEGALVTRVAMGVDVLARTSEMVQPNSERTWIREQSSDRLVRAVRHHVVSRSDESIRAQVLILSAKARTANGL